MAVINCEDNSNNIAQKLFISFDQGNSFTEINLDGITGMVRGITFTGPYTLAVWSENTGYYYLDLNLVSTTTVNSAGLLCYPNPIAAGKPIFIKNFSGDTYRIISADGRLIFSGDLYKPIIAPEKAGIYFIELENNATGIHRERIVVTD
jgi:hypothetical protein